MSAFEIIYDDKQEMVIGSNEIDITTLKIVKDGWIQNEGTPFERVLFLSQIQLIPKKII